MKSVGFKFFYELEGGSLTFSIDRAIKREDKNPFLVSRANFHRNLDTSKMSNIEQIKINLVNILNDWEKFQQLHAIIIEK